MQKVSAVLVTYNRLKLLKKAIDAIQQQTYKVNTIVIIDNNSTDGTKEYIESLSLETKIDYVRLSENGGGAMGFNQGVRYFVEHTNDDLIWLMDDDTIPYPDTLEKLLQFGNSVGKFGFLYSNVRWIDGSFSEPNHPWANNKPIPDGTVKAVKVTEGNFVSLLMNRDIVQKIGLPYKEFFIWQDDIEYTRRASRVAPGYWVPQAKVVHETGANVAPNIMTIDQSRINRFYYDIRNALFIRRTEKGFAGLIYLAIIKVLGSVRILFSNTDHKKEKLSVYKKGIIDGFKFKPSREFAKSK